MDLWVLPVFVGSILPAGRDPCCSTDSCSRSCLTNASSPPIPSATAPADVEGAACFSIGADAGGASIGAGCCAGVSSCVLTSVSDVASCFDTQRSNSFCCPMGTFDFRRSSASKQLRASSDENPIATTTSHVSEAMFLDAAHARTFVSSSASCWASAMMVYGLLSPHYGAHGSVFVWHGTDLPVHIQPHNGFLGRAKYISRRNHIV